MQKKSNQVVAKPPPRKPVPLPPLAAKLGHGLIVTTAKRFQGPSVVAAPTRRAQPSSALLQKKGNGQAPATRLGPQPVAAWAANTRNRAQGAIIQRSASTSSSSPALASSSAPANQTGQHLPDSRLLVAFKYFPEGYQYLDNSDRQALLGVSHRMNALGFNPRNTAVLHRLSSLSLKKTLKQIWPGGVSDRAVHLVNDYKPAIARFESEKKREFEELKHEIDEDEAEDFWRTANAQLKQLEEELLANIIEARNEKEEMEHRFEQTGAKYVPAHFADAHAHPAHTWETNEHWLYQAIRRFNRVALTDLPLNEKNLVRGTPHREDSFSAYAREIAFLLLRDYSPDNRLLLYPGVQMQFLHRRDDGPRLTELDRQTLQSIVDDKHERVSADQMLDVFRRLNLRVAAP